MVFPKGEIEKGILTFSGVKTLSISFQSLFNLCTQEEWGQFQPVTEVYLSKRTYKSTYLYRPVEEGFDVTNFYYSHQKKNPPLA